MQLPLQSFSGLVQQMAASVQGAAAQLIDLTVGSVLRALLEASASVALWLQWLIMQVLTATRAATSLGADLDSWMADYGLRRLPGVASSGTVTFSRYTTGLATVVPVGAQVRTNDGSVTFAVVAVPSNPAWNGSGYGLPSNVASVDVPMQAVAVGGAGNVQAGAIGILATAIAGVDFVSNAAPFTGGLDAEPDAAFRARFQLYINSRSLGTRGALAFAVASVQQGLRYAILENQDPNGVFLPGNFCIAADDGSGAPSAGLLSAVQAGVDAVRPIGSTYRVAGPVVLLVSVSLVLETNNPGTKASVAATVQQSVIAWIGELPMGGTLAISKIDAIAHAADASVISAMNVLVNGSDADVTAPANGVLIADSVTVS